MARPLPPEDTLPWYRQFWPWFLILLPATVVVAGLSTLLIANRHADDLVVDEYYKDGLAINRKLEKIQRAAQLGVSANLHFTAGTVTADTAGPVEAPRLSLLLSHPLEADRDFRLDLDRVGPGQYRGELPDAVAPRWHWALELPGPQGWRLDGSIQAADIDHVPDR
jgi:hypothetical protein